MNWLYLLLIIPTIPLLWFGRKIYFRLTVEKLRFIFTTTNGKTVKSFPLEPTQENMNQIPEFLSDNERGGYITIFSRGNEATILPRKFIENCAIRTKIIRTFSK